MDSAALLLVFGLCLFADSIMQYGVGVFVAVSAITLDAAGLLHMAAERPHRAKRKALRTLPTKASAESQS